MISSLLTREFVPQTQLSTRGLADDQTSPFRPKRLRETYSESTNSRYGHHQDAEFGIEGTKKVDFNDVSKSYSAPNGTQEAGWWQPLPS